MINYEPNHARPAPEHDGPLLDCPTCGLPAEITDRFTLNGAPAPVEHIKMMCVRRHWYTLPVDQLPPSRPVPDRADSTQMPQRG